MKGKKNISAANVLIEVNNMLGRFSAEEIVKGFVEDYPAIKDDFKKVLYDNGFRWQKDSYQGNGFGMEGLWINYGLRLSIRARWGKVNANAIIYVEKEFFGKVKKFFDLYIPYQGMDSENSDYDLLNRGEIFKKEKVTKEDNGEKEEKEEKKEKKNVPLLYYINQIEKLNFVPVSKYVWDIVRLEGLNKEQGRNKRKDWLMAELSVLENDIEKLKKLDDEALNFFNEFDIKLKEKYNMKFIDLVDYDRGAITIVKIAENIDK